MSNLEKEILKSLKDQFIKVNEESFDFMASHEFYLNKLDNNLFKPMSGKTVAQYNKGNGGELKENEDTPAPFKALKSSAAMTYNIFGNTDFIFQGNNIINKGIYGVEFEKKLEVLSGRNKANLDSFLYNKETKNAVACEMKMTEWFTSGSHNLRRSYFEKSSYKYVDAADIFIQIAKSLVIDSNKDLEEYKCNLKTYDALQMFKHTIACYNLCRSKTLPIDKLTLVNCVWALPFNCFNIESDSIKNKYNSLLEDEKIGYQTFILKMNEIQKLFLDCGVEFEIQYYSLNDFVSKMQISEEQNEYLKRYTFA